MKGLLLLFGLIALLLNIVFGSLLDIYPVFNMRVNCGVIALTTILLFALNYSTMKAAFRISLTALFSILGVIMLVLSVLSAAELKNNGFIVAICLIIAFEAVVLAICNVISKLKKGDKNGK